MAEKNEYVITRVFNAPRDLMFKVWTDPEHLSHWFGPKGVIVKKAKLDLRPGGIYHTSMQAPGGPEMWAKWTYREVVAPERVVWVQTFSDEKGGLTRHPMSATWPLEMLTTVLFDEEGSGTKVTLKWMPVNATPEEIATFMKAFEGMNMGWGGTFEQLDAYLTSIRK